MRLRFGHGALVPKPSNVGELRGVCPLSKTFLEEPILELVLEPELQQARINGGSRNLSEVS